MSAQMFVVARRHPELYDYLSARLAGDPNVRVVLDRRFAPRRRRALPAAAERRRGNRRTRPEIDEQLRATSLAVVTAAPAAKAAASSGDARQWVDAMQRGVEAVRLALDDHERLQLKAQAITKENQRLRAEIDRSVKDLAELDGNLGRAIELVTDLRARLSKEPDRHSTR
jgi:hypothetical protein